MKLIVAGVCNTDLELQRGYYNFCGTPGHEFVAEVVSSENASLVGERVVGEINIACGSCDFCERGLARHCRNRLVLGIAGHQGAFAEYFTLPDSNLHVLPEGVTNEEAVFAEPIAAACEILDQISLLPGTEIAVLGDGKLGLLITQVLLVNGMRPTLYGRHPAKLQLAQAAGAATQTIDDLPKASYSCVVECTGSPDGVSIALDIVRPRGTVVLKSTIHSRQSIDMARIIVNEITLVGSRCGRFEPALELLASKKLALIPMISAEFPLIHAARAFEKAASKGTLKVLLRG